MTTRVYYRKSQKRDSQTENKLILELTAQQDRLEEELRQLRAALEIYREIDRRMEYERKRNSLDDVSLRSCA